MHPHPTSSRARAGFTLVEVILATVVGVVMLAGAAYLYGQARVNSGTSRAQEKVMALQQLVEEYASINNGAYPLSSYVVTTFQARRTDWNQSPWGGPLPTHNPAGVEPGDSVTPPSNAGKDFLQADVASATVPALMGYYTLVAPPANATESMYDNSVGATVSIRNYAVWNQGRDGNGILVYTGK